MWTSATLFAFLANLLSPRHVQALTLIFPGCLTLRMAMPPARGSALQMRQKCLEVSHFTAEYLPIPSRFQQFSFIFFWLADYLLILPLWSQNLSSKLYEENWTPDAEEVGQVALSLAKGIAYIHSKGVLHRDIKPANVLSGAYPQIAVFASAPPRLRVSTFKDPDVCPSHYQAGFCWEA